MSTEVMRTGNPALKADTFNVPAMGAESMTIQGTVNKTFILLGLTIITAYWAWNNPATGGPLALGAALAAFIVALVTVFKKTWSPVTAPLYVLLEGVFLGAFSLVMEASYPGIVFQAVLLTFGTLFALLTAYKSRLIPVTENFRLGIVAATGGIALVYLVSIILSFFGKQIPMIHQSGTVGILFSLFVVVIAALNLVLDFDFIERGAEHGAPKYMEWYAAFGLMVTLIWLYLEMLRLLSKARSKQ